jgi:hypothetical protein
MARKIVSLQKFFEIVGKADRIKLNYIVLKAQNPTWVYVPMNEIK